MFAEQGMEKASMAQIASHSGVSKALLYHYYPSKDVLIFAIIHEHLVDLEASVAAAIDDGLPPEEQLRVLVRRGARQIPRRGRRPQGAARRLPALSDEQRAEIRAVERQIVRHFSQGLARSTPTSTAPSARSSCRSPCRSSG